MRVPYGPKANENCSTCKLRGNGFFCQLPQGGLKDFDAIKFVSTYPDGAVLFMEKQAPRGIYLLCQGAVKLSVCSSEGKTLILRIAQPGEALGLMASVAGAPYEVTAEALRPCRVTFVRRESFLRLLAAHPEVYPSVVTQMASQYQAACEQIRTLGLSGSVSEKLAKLLLDWSAEPGCSMRGVGTKLPLTHEEIAEFIGTTRESVTRTLNAFKNRQLVIVRGSILTIPNRAALENCVSA